MANMNTEAGTRSNRLEFCRVGATDFIGGPYPTDPEFEPYSGTINNTSWSIDSNIEAIRGLGTVDPTDHLKGPESNELTVNYNLERWFSNGGSAYDAAYDGIYRNGDNLLPNTHVIVERTDKGMIHADNTISEDSARPSRTFKIAYGAKVDTVTVTGDPSDTQPVTIALDYLSEKVRVYQIDQPLSSGVLSIASTSSDDTNTVTVEDEGSTTSEEIVLDGDTPVSTTEEFGDIDAVYVDGYHEGDVTVTGPDDSVLAEIDGGNQYRSVESDAGIPILGDGGSRADYSSVGTPETFIGDRLERGTDPIAYEFNSAELTVENNIEETERGSTFSYSLDEGARDTQLSVTAFGESESYKAFMNHLTVMQNDTTWEMDGGTLTLPNAALVEPGDVEMEAEQAIATSDNVFESQGIEISEA